MKKIKNYGFYIVFGVILILFFIFSINYNKNRISDTSYVFNESENVKSKINSEKYNECLNEKLELDLSEYENELNLFLDSYNISVYYESINYGYSYKYKTSKVFYGASLIKLVDVLYILDNNIDLNDTKVYESTYHHAGSNEMSKRKYGEKITLKELITYILTCSDNTAHDMLVDYIGYNNLKNYGLSLGAKNILNIGDNFGNQSTDDMIIYLKKLYELINDNENYEFIKESMNNDYDNKLNFDDKYFYHKYGLYSVNYHDVGIFIGDNPYYVAILTRESNNKDLVTEISKKIYELNEKYLEEQKNYCEKILFDEN